MQLTALLSQRERINTYDVGSKPTATFPQRVCHGESRVIPEWIVRSLEEKSFKPHVLFSNGHAQTILAYAWPRYLTLSISDHQQQRLFEVEPKVRLLAHCHWQTDPVMHPTLLIRKGATCLKKRHWNVRRKTSARGRLRARRPESSFEKRLSTFAKGSTVPDQPSKQSRLDCRKPVGRE